MRYRAQPVSAMSSSRPLRRFLSSSVAFFAATAPILGFYLAIVAGLSATWWLGVNLALGVLVGFRYSRRAYSLPRLWEFVWAAWKSLVVVHVAMAVVFRANFTDVRGFGVPGRILFGGLAFVVFAVVYGASFQRAYLKTD